MQPNNTYPWTKKNIIWHAKIFELKTRIRENKLWMELLSCLFTWLPFRRWIRGSQPFLMFGFRCRCLSVYVCVRLVLLVLGFAALSVVWIGRRALLVRFDFGLIFLGLTKNVALCHWRQVGRVCSYPQGLLCVSCVDLSTPTCWTLCKICHRVTKALWISTNSNSVHR